MMSDRYPLLNLVWLSGAVFFAVFAGMRSVEHEMTLAFAYDVLMSLANAALLARFIVRNA